MPGGDRRGPRGMGPMTGRRMGYCAENDRLGFGPGFGRGFGRRGGVGFGRGYGRAWADYPQETAVPEYPDSITELVAEVALLREHLAALEERLADQKNKD